MRVYFAAASFYASMCCILIALVLGANSSNKNPIDELLQPYIGFVDGVFEYLQDGGIVNITKTCQHETRSIVTLAKEGDRDALRFLDATGKPLSGILVGGYSFLGFYSECLATTVHNTTLNNNIQGKYCLVQLYADGENSTTVAMPQTSWTVFVHSHKRPSFGFCIPFSCSTDDVHTAVNQSLSQQLYTNIEDTTDCYEEYYFTQDSTAISITFLYILFLGIEISATLYEVFSPHCPKTIQIPPGPEVENAEQGAVQEVSSYTFLEHCFLSFSLKANAIRLLSPEAQSSSGNEHIGALHGIRFFTMVLIIMLHTFSFAMQNLHFRNSEAMLQASSHFLSQIFANGTLAVDSFYFMSGLLVTYVGLKTIEKNMNKFDLGCFFIHRIIRLTPLLLMVIAFCVGLLRYTGSGPNWPMSIMMYDDWCRKNWWLTALNLQNFIDTDYMCLSHSWYVATDFQLYMMMMPPILYFLSRNFLHGIILIGVFFALNIFTIITLTVSYNYPAVPYMSNIVPLDVLNNYFKDIYIKPYCRMGPYLVGVLIGCIFVKKPELRLNKVCVMIGWMGAIVLNMIVMFGMLSANNGELPSVGIAALYGAFARPLWALSVGWITVACAYGYGGFVNKFLSWDIFVPLSRLTYCAYLIHPVMISIYNGCIEMEMDFSYVNMLYVLVGNIVFTYFISFFLTLMFETPFAVLERVIQTKRQHNNFL